MKMPLKIVLFFCCTLMTFIISADTTWTWTYDLAKAEWKDRKCVFPDPSTYESSFTGAHFPILEACFMVEVNKPTSGPELQQLNLCQLLYGLSILCCSHKKQFVETSLIKEEINKITSDFESGSKDRNVCSYASNLPMNISQHLPYLANKATCQQICMGKNAHEKRFEPVCELFVAVMCKLGGKEKCDLPSKTGSGGNDPSGETEPPRHSTQPPQNNKTETNFTRKINSTADVLPKQTSPPSDDRHTPGPSNQTSPPSDDRHTPGPSNQTSPPSDDRHTPGPPNQTSPPSDDRHTPGPSNQTSPPSDDRHTPGPPNQTSPPSDDSGTPGPPKQTPPPDNNRIPGPPRQTSPPPDDSNNPGPSNQTSPPPDDSHTPGPCKQTGPPPGDSRTNGPPKQTSPPPDDSNNPGPSNQTSPPPDDSHTPGPRKQTGPPPGDSRTLGPPKQTGPPSVKPYGSLKSSQPRKLSEPYYSDIGHEQEKGEKKLYGDNKREHSEPALKESSSYKMKNLFPLFVIVIIVLVICGSFITYSKCFAKKNKVSKSIFSVMDQTQSKHNFTIYKPWKQPGHTKLKDTDDSLPLLV